MAKIPLKGSERKALPGFQAATGWDACTGLGSPRGDALVNGII
jgi:hypothetical protein